MNQLLQEILQGLPFLYGELALIAGSIVLLMIGLFSLPRNSLKLITAAILVAAILLIPDGNKMLFNGMLINDDIGRFLKFLFLCATLVLLVYRTQQHHVPEFYFLLIAVLAGSFFMVSSLNFLLIYLSIELTSYGSYFLSGFRFTKHSSESAFKYLLFGGVSSAVMLFGISLLYGDSSGLFISELSNTYLSKIGLLLFIAGIFFKISAVPFHIWVPSTYQESPTDVVAFFSIVPKLAGFGLLIHLVKHLNAQLSTFIIPILVVMAIITVLWGTFTAIPQKDVKRLVAFGAIAHSGFLLPISLINNNFAITSFCFYATVYAVMNLAIFYFIQAHESDGNVRLVDLSGMGKTNPMIGAAGLVILISLVGLPPTGGFTAKLLLFSSIWNEFETTSQYIWLTFTIVAILSSAVSLYFYLRIPYYYFLREKGKNTIHISGRAVLVTTFFALGLILLFIQPNILDNFMATIRP